MRLCLVCRVFAMFMGQLPLRACTEADLLYENRHPCARCAKERE